VTNHPSGYKRLKSSPKSSNAPMPYFWAPIRTAAKSTPIGAFLPNLATLHNNCINVIDIAH